jgi:hypothetical protein
MLLLLHCCLQEAGDALDLDWEDIMERAAAAGTAGDLLQPAVNCTNDRVASGASLVMAWHFERGSARLEADVACRTLLTAAVRQHAHALVHLGRSKVYEQQADAHMLEELLNLVVHWPCDGGCAALFRLMALQQLCKMPAAAQLSSEQVAALLHRAVQSIDGYGFQALLSLPAAEWLSSVCMEQLLCLAVVRDRARRRGVCTCCATCN